MTKGSALGLVNRRPKISTTQAKPSPGKDCLCSHFYGIEELPYRDFNPTLPVLPPNGMERCVEKVQCFLLRRKKNKLNDNNYIAIRFDRKLVFVKL